MTSDTRGTLAAGAATALTCSALAPIFAAGDWLPAVLSVIAVVTATALLSRRLHLPELVEPVVALVAMLEYVVLVFVPGTTLLAVVPTPDSLRGLDRLLRQGFDDIAQLTTPVPPHDGILLVAVLGIGAVTLLVHLVAVGLGRPALAGLPLAALFFLPAGIVDEDLGVVAFALAAIGFLVLLLARGGSTASGRMGGHRIGVGALALAVVVPLLLPSLPSRSVGGQGFFDFGDSSNSITTYNPIASLKGQLQRQEPQLLLRITTTDDDPGYLRMATLDQFDGESWSQSQLSASPDQRVANGLPAPHGLSPNTPAAPVHSTIRASDTLALHWLPTYYPPRAIEAEGDWRYDETGRTVFSTRTDTRGLVYEVTSLDVAPTRAQLRAAGAAGAEMAPDTRVPDAISPRVVDLVQGITAGAGSAYEKAVALQRFFRVDGGFVYSLRVPQGTSEDALVNFLFGARAGYCEQYAAAMALMARIAGIPSRVAVGFTQGTRRADRGEWWVTTDDAHAWPELFFPGAGWLPFEPTPLATGGAVVPDYSLPLPGEAGTGAAPPGAVAPPLPAAQDQTAVQDDPRPPAPTPGPGATAIDGDSSNSSIGVAVGLLVLVGALAALATPAVARVATRRRRWRRTTDPADAAAAAWSEIVDDATDLGWRPDASRSPRAAAEWLVSTAELSGPAAEAVHEVARAEEHARYAPQMPAVTPSALRAATRRVRAELLRAAGRRQRWRTRLLPGSALTTIRRSGSGLRRRWVAAPRDRARTLTVVARRVGARRGAP